MPWLDTIILIVVAALGLMILYRALHEPIDLIISLLGRFFHSVTDSAVQSNGVTKITYGS